MTRARGEEAWVAACIEAILPGVEVRHHDDGSTDSMHDLDLIREGIVFGACEVTAAGDPQLIELWNLVNGDSGRRIEPGLQGGWMLSLRPQCRVKRLMQELRPLLGDLEARQIRGAGSGHVAPPDVEIRLDELDIDHVMQSGTDFPGSVYFTIALPLDMSTAFVSETGDPLCEWLENWIDEPAQRHNIVKLVGSSAPEKHLFVLVPGFSEAPFVAADVLMRDDGPLPTRAPRLPSGLTHLWVMSMWSSGSVFSWSPVDGWSKHEKADAATTGLRDG